MNTSATAELNITHEQFGGLSTIDVQEGDVEQLKLCKLNLISTEPACPVSQLQVCTSSS
jgi:hypothetical protein